MLNNNNVEFGVEWPKVLYVLRNMLNNKVNFEVYFASNFSVLLERFEERMAGHVLDKQPDNLVGFRW